MTTDDGFLQAIRAEPDDDAVRLIYADWLQEQDDPVRRDRGEFILVQVELARMGSSHPHYLSLETREVTLLTRNWKAWVGPLGELVGASTWESWTRGPFRLEALAPFRRGFVQALTLPAAIFLARASELFRLTPLRWLGLVGANSRAGDLADCPFLADLQTLSFLDYFTDPLDAGAAHCLAASPHLGRLRVLNLFSNNLAWAGVEALVTAPWLAHLKELNLNNNGIGDAGAVTLANGPSLPDLRCLGLNYNGITDRGARALARSSALARLRTLNLAGNAITTEGQRELQRSPYLAEVTRLDLERNPCTNS